MFTNITKNTSHFCTFCVASDDFSAYKFIIHQWHRRSSYRFQVRQKPKTLDMDLQTVCISYGQLSFNMTSQSQWVFLIIKILIPGKPYEISEPLIFISIFTLQHVSTAQWPILFTLRRHISKKERSGTKGQDTQ